jgi:hypothetical protein
MNEFVLVKPSPSKPPFDVQHRHIIFYTQDSPSDFRKLQTEVTEWLKAQIEKATAMQTVASLSAVKTTDSGLSSYEIAVMVSIMENRLIPSEGVTPNEIRKDMRSAGYTDIATSLSLESLQRKALIEYEEASNNFGESYTVCVLSSRGLDWMASFAVAGILGLLACFLVIRSKQRSSWWLLLAALGPFGFAVLALLSDRASTEADRHMRFVRSLNRFARVGYEVCRYICPTSTPRRARIRSRRKKSCWARKREAPPRSVLQH